MRRGGNKTIMIGRQREPRRAHLEGQMARMQTTPADKQGFCKVWTLASDLWGRIHRVYIMDIAHPDVDGVAEHSVEVTTAQDEATTFLASNIDGILAEALRTRTIYEQGGEAILYIRHESGV
jgi:hypothetical protein